MPPIAAASAAAPIAIFAGESQRLGSATPPDTGAAGGVELVRGTLLVVAAARPGLGSRGAGRAAD